MTKKVKRRVFKFLFDFIFFGGMIAAFDYAKGKEIEVSTMMMGGLFYGVGMLVFDVLFLDKMNKIEE